MSLLKIVGTVIASCLLIIVLLAVLAIDSEPAVDSRAAEQISDADTVNRLLEQIQQSVDDRFNEHVIKVSESQVASLVGFMQRAAPYFKGNVSITDEQGTLEASIAVPVLWGEGYINVNLQILPDDKLNVGHLKIGSLTIPGSVAVGLGEWIINTYTDSDIGSQAKNQIARVSMTPSSVAVTIRPMDGFLHSLNDVRAGLGATEPDQLTERTAYYLRYIAGRDISLDRKSHSISDYLRLIMARAREQSQSPEDAVAHNKAAILALAVFLGHHRVANLVGDVQPDVEHALKPAAPATLRGRSDLAKHFIISAALKMLSEQSVTFAIGEFKELMDRGMGGSGYSFIDLTADLAGVELGKVLGDPQTALSAQDELARVFDESVYMPDIDGLIEGLSKQEFTTRYDKVDSDAYLEEVARIKARLAQIPLYQHLEQGD